MYFVFHSSVVVIIDPGINNADNYKPYQDGVAEDIFIKVCDVYQFHGSKFQPARNLGSKSSQL